MKARLMAEPPTATVVHRLPGRIRLRIPDRRGDLGYFDMLALELAMLDQVRGVSVNPATTSVLLRYDEPLDRLIETARTQGLFTLADLTLHREPIEQRLRQTFASADVTVREATAGELDLMAASALGMLGLAALQALRGQLLGPAFNLAWYAGTLFLLRPSMAAVSFARQNNIDARPNVEQISLGGRSSRCTPKQTRPRIRGRLKNRSAT
jgi:hypothetical protein